MREQNLIDIFEFARGEGELCGELSLDAMPQLASCLTGDGKGVIVRYRVCPCRGKRELPAVELTLEASVTTSCVYCGEACRIHIEKTLPFLLTQTEAQADALPIEEDGEYDVVVGSDHFDLAAWIEEELILSLPAFPRHDACRGATLTGAQDTPGTALENKPFAGLAELLKH